MAPESVLIIGAGQAGAQTTASLRQNGFSGSITLVGDEPVLPYQRPPLSKAYLKGELATERLHLKPADWYAAQNIDVLTKTSITSVDLTAKTAATDAGKVITFDHLVFATGARNRQLPIEGSTLNNVFGLRDLADVDSLRPNIGPGKKLVIIGAGYIGLETTAVARGLGADVTVLELADRVLERVTSPTISKFYEALHHRHGVTIKTAASTTSINGKNGRAESVTLSTGEVLPCDAVLIGIGILPNIEIAAEAGIECEDGILVDEAGLTQTPAVYAAGDCTKRLIQPYGRMGRLESVHNAIEQGKQVAAAICGKPAPKTDCPWFWSDQYDVKLQIAGLSTGFDKSVIRGSIAEDKFAVFYFRDDILIAADAVNSAPEFMTAKRLISARAKVSPAALVDPQTSLKALMALHTK